MIELFPYSGILSLVALGMSIFSVAYAIKSKRQSRRFTYDAS